MEKNNKIYILDSNPDFCANFNAKNSVAEQTKICSATLLRINYAYDKTVLYEESMEEYINQEMLVWAMQNEAQFNWLFDLNDSLTQRCRLFNISVQDFVCDIKDVGRHLSKTKPVLPKIDTSYRFDIEDDFFKSQRCQYVYDYAFERKEKLVFHKDRIPFWFKETYFYLINHEFET